MDNDIVMVSSPHIWGRPRAFGISFKGGGWIKLKGDLFYRFF